MGRAGRGVCVRACPLHAWEAARRVLPQLSPPTAPTPTPFAGAGSSCTQHAAPAAGCRLLAPCMASGGRPALCGPQRTLASPPPRNLAAGNAAALVACLPNCLQSPNPQFALPRRALSDTSLLWEQLTMLLRYLRPGDLWLCLHSAHSAGWRGGRRGEGGAGIAGSSPVARPASPVARARADPLPAPPHHPRPLREFPRDPSVQGRAAGAQVGGP